MENFSLTAGMQAAVFNFSSNRNKVESSITYNRELQKLIQTVTNDTLKKIALL